jgi:hypothetical protein
MAKKINREEIKAEVKRRQQNAARDYTEKANLIAAGYKTAKTNSASGSAGKKPIGASNSKSNVLSQIDEIRNDLGSRNKLSADALMANNPAYVYTKAYGDGKTGAAANRPVKGTATPRSRFEPADTGRPLGRASAQRAFTSTPTGNFKGEAILKSALSSSGAAYKKLGADVTSPTGNLSMGESARAAINEAKTAKKEGRQVRPGQAQRKAEQEKIKSFNDGWAGDFKQKLLESAEESSKRAHEFEQEAKQGLGKFGQGVVDFGIAGAQFAGDALLNAVAPGAGIAAMAGRAYGSASLDAQQRGLSEGEQQVFGLKSAAIEVLTEKLFGAASKIAYGKGIIKNESLVNSLVNRLAKTDKGRTALKVIVGANEEGLEEVLSDILNPVADRVLKLDDGKGDWSDLGEDMDAEQMLEDYIIGSTLGLFGAGTNVISGQYRAENAQQRAYESYQRELVNAGLASEQGSQTQLTAEEYQNILDNSAKRGNRNLSDKETANLEQLITAERDTPVVRNALERSGALVDDNTASVIAKAASGQKLTRAEQSIINSSPVMQQAVNTMSGSGAVANIRTTAAKNSVVNSMAERYTVSPEVISRTYDLAPVASPEAFEMAFDAVYQMGQQGANKESLTKVPVLNRAQAEIAYNMGASTTQAAVDNAAVQGDNVSTQVNNQVSNAVNNTIQEVNNNGVRLRDSSQRLNGQNTEGQIPAVERGTVEAYTGTDSGRQSGYSAAQGKAGQKVVYNGVEQENVYYSGEDTESMKKGRELARSYGYNVQYFEGGNIKDSGGEFRGMVDTESKTVMVRSDHPDISAEQIMRHEMGHAAIAQGDISLDELRSAMLSDLSEEELNSAVEVYRHAYGDTISEAEAFEEMCCDALGKINIFAGTEHDSANYGKAQESFRKHTAETANKGRAPPKKGGEMYSREVNGKKIAWIENSPLTAKELHNHKKVAAYIANHIGEAYTIIESGSKVYLGESLPGEYTQSEYTKQILKNVPPILKAKNKAIGKLGEMIEIATNRRWEKAKHADNKDAEYGIYRYSTAFAFPVKQNSKVTNVKSFDAELIILNASDGKKYLYDIVSIKENTADEVDLFKKDQMRQNASARRGASENSIRSSSENVNKKFSREPESITELRRQNRELKKRVDYWKGQTQRTKVKIVRQSDVNRLAREVIDMSESDLKPQDITERLSKLGEHILNEKELRYTDIAEMAQDIAEDVVSNATTIVNEDDVQTHNRLRGYLKRVKLKDDGSAEFESIRNSYKRRIMFNKNGMSVDSAYAELNSMFGEGYFPEDIINPADQLERIVEVLDGTAPQHANPNGYYAEEAAEYMRNYIIDSMLSDQVRQTAPTMADKAAAREAKLKADNAERIKNAVKKERERNEVKLQRFKEGVARLDSKRKETALKNRYRGQIEKNVNTLSKWLLNPDHKNTLKHIPGQLQSTVRDFISAIDFTSSQQLGGGAPTIKDMKYIDSLDRLRRYIADSKVGEDRYSDLDLPPEFETQLADFVSSVNTLARNNKGTYTINDMTSEQLKELSDIVKTMKKAITDMNRLYQNATFQHVYEAGESDIETLREYTKTKAFTSKLAANRLDQAIMWESSRPAHVFKRFGKGGESMYQEFVDGQNTMAFLTKEVIDFAEDTYTTAEVKQWAKETHEFKFGDQRVKLTSAQLMSLYELNKRSQAKQHLDSGGFRVANFKDGKFNLQTDKEKHVFTDTELNEMFGELTGRQKEVADKLQHFMVERGGEWGNYVSRKRFDVEMFKDENYFPIKIDTTETDSKVDEKTDNASLYQLLNMGFTKETSAKANQSIVVYDIFDVFANHMSEMAQYRSFALPLLDMTKWFNIKVRDESGNVTASLRTEMRKAFGSDKNGRGFAEQFVTGIIKAYNGAEGRGDSSVNSRMINRVNRAAVAYNTRVMIQQPSAIVRAALYLDPKDLISSLKNYAGISTKQNIEEMHKHSGIALWKDLGFYDVNVSRGVQELIKHSQGTISKINEIGMKGAEFADKVTWAALWDASKKQVRRETGLSESDAEFFPKVSKVFENVIYNTQVVDTVLTKSEVSRNRSSGARLFTSFMSEPMTTASLVTSEIFDIQMKQAKGIKLKPSDYSRLSKTCIVVAVAAVVNSALASLADAWRDDDEYGTFGQKWTRAMRIKLADELNPLTYLPYASNVWDVTKAFLDWTDTKWFGVEVYGNGTDIPFADILESTEKAVKIFGEIREKGEDSKYTKFGGYYKVVNVLSKITGIPLYNIAREGVSLYNTFASNKIRSYEPSKEGAVKYAWNDGYLTDDEAIAALQDDAGMDEGEAWLEVEKWKNDTTSNYTKLYDAIDNGGDIKKAVDELTEHGVEEKNIKSSLTRRYKDAYINGDNKEREKIRRALYATGVYGSVNEVIEKCNSWLKK